VSVWAPRRFWTEASVVPDAGGFAVQLDARRVHTPRKTPLVLPTKALAEAVAAEWRAVESRVDPSRMPVTRRANSAIDTVVPQFDGVVAMLADYGGSDLLCYRAEGPADLIERQRQAWDPLLSWSETALSAPLTVTTGVMHVAQPASSRAALTGAVRQLTAFQLSAFHDLVALSGSLVLALAVTRGRLTAEAAWSLSRIDEDWQIEAWGADEEAAEAAALKRADFQDADRFFTLCG
jgi:chaperone required for assembly of F1-ATPase